MLLALECAFRVPPQHHYFHLCISAAFLLCRTQDELVSAYSESEPYSEFESDASRYVQSYSDSDSERTDASSDTPLVPETHDPDLLVFRQSANFMLKLSEMIYNHALELSVKRSVENFAKSSMQAIPGAVNIY